MKQETGYRMPTVYPIPYLHRIAVLPHLVDYLDRPAVVRFELRVNGGSARVWSIDRRYSLSKNNYYKNPRKNDVITADMCAPLQQHRTVHFVQLCSWVFLPMVRLASLGDFPFPADPIYARLICRFASGSGQSFFLNDCSMPLAKVAISKFQMSLYSMPLKNLIGSTSFQSAKNRESLIISDMCANDETHIAHVLRAASYSNKSNLALATARLIRHTSIQICSLKQFQLGYDDQKIH